jgi:hypothetical protein
MEAYYYAWFDFCDLGEIPSQPINTSLLNTYRAKIGETATNAPLASKVYDDAMLLAGVAAIHELTQVPVDTLLREYGCYFLTNGLTSSRCSYLLTQVQSGRDLLLVMRDAHAQMRRIPDASSTTFDTHITHSVEVIFKAQLMLLT